MTLSKAKKDIEEIIAKYGTGFSSVTEDTKEGEIRYIILSMKWKVDKNTK